MKIVLLILIGVLIAFIYFFHLKKEVLLLKNSKRSVFFNFYARMAILFLLFLPILLLFKEYGIVSIISFLLFRYVYLFTIKKKLS